MIKNNEKVDARNSGYAHFIIYYAALKSDEQLLAVDRGGARCRANRNDSRFLEF